VPILTFDEPWHIASWPRYASELYAVTSNRGPGFSHSLQRLLSPGQAPWPAGIAAKPTCCAS
jgi:hypothetical protein